MSTPKPLCLCRQRSAKDDPSRSLGLIYAARSWQTLKIISRKGNKRLAVGREEIWEAKSGEKKW